MEDKKIHICFFSGDITRGGGTERVAVIIANELCRSRKYNVSVLSLEERNESPFYKIDQVIRTYKLYKHLNRGIVHIVGIIGKLIRHIKRDNVDVLIDIDGILDIYSLPAKFFTKIRVISWEHFNFYQNPFVPYRKLSRKMAARWADAIITLTEEDKGYYQQNLNLRCPIQCIYNPIIWDGKEHCYHKDSNLILSVGRLTYQKGFDRLVEIAKKVLPKHPEWTWVILGEGEEREFLEKKIKEYHLREQLILKGNVNHVEPYYEQAAFLVMTSRYEGLPMTLLETKPYRLPLISFRCKTGPEELIEDGNNGYLIEENNIQKMTEAVEKLIQDQSMRIIFSEQATKDLEKFQLQAIVRQWEQLLDGIANKRG